ncbi:MAG TPA: HD domain-containing phosphohydrolase [Thermoanaerobaculia bacterium]|nr:HD domain-containing phosphohydrolase [Thermoanaerobaculia bacterium]
MDTSLRPRIRLFALLVAALAVVSLTPLLVTDRVLISWNRESLETMEKKYTARSASAIADSISAFYRSSEEQLETLADTMKFSQALSGKNPFSTTAASGILPDFVKGRSTFLALRVIDQEGQGGAIGPRNLPAAVEQEFRRGYLQGRDGQRYSGNPVQAPGFSSSVVVIAEPVAGESGENIGVVEGLVSWQPIERQIDEEARQEITVALLDHDGNILLASKNRPASRPAGSLFADFRQSPSRVRLTRADRSAGQSVLGSIVPVESPDWAVLVERDQRLAFASVDEMTRQTIFWSLLALGLAIGVGVVMAIRLASPIRALAEQAHDIAEGRYGQRVEVRGAAEIADLSSSFNRMSESIERAMTDLKKAARENHELFINSVRALAAAIDAKDPYTRGHSERVARYAVSIARAMDLPPEEVRKVRLSALLHDVGKIGIDDRILRKPTALTDEEFEVMKTHPAKGAAIMSAIPQLADVVPGMKHHHEKWEGGGYPDGLKGEEIPLLARIVSVADTFDAMTTTRPYQKAMEITYVIGRIQSLAGTRFDKRITDVLVKAYQNGDLLPSTADTGSAVRTVA